MLTERWRVVYAWFSYGASLAHPPLPLHSVLYPLLTLSVGSDMVTVIVVSQYLLGAKFLFVSGKRRKTPLISLLQQCVQSMLWLATQTPLHCCCITIFRPTRSARTSAISGPAMFTVRVSVSGEILASRRVRRRTVSRQCRPELARAKAYSLPH